VSRASKHTLHSPSLSYQICPLHFKLIFVGFTAIEVQFVKLWNEGPLEAYVFNDILLAFSPVGRPPGS